MTAPDNKSPRWRASFVLPLAGFAVLVVIASLALFSTLSGSRNVAQLPSVLIGKTPPDIALPLLNGDAGLALTAFDGEPVLVNFFASWCAPCRAEAPALELLSKDIKIIGIAYKDKSSDTRQFLADYGNPFSAVAMDFDGKAGLKWGVYGVPETYLLGADGRVLLRHAGPIDRRVITDELMPAIEAAR